MSQPRSVRGCGWRGFHHHATLCIAAYAFLISERRRFLPQDLPPPRGSKSLRFQRLQTPRRRQSGPNAIWRTLLPACIGGSPWCSREACRVIRAAPP